LKAEPADDKPARRDDLGEAARNLGRVERSAAVVYPKTPNTAGLKEEIEVELGGWGISAVWFDEPPAEGSPAWHAWQAMHKGRL
jgi:hypothetical protein